MRVVVVEDDRILCAALVEALAHHGIDVPGAAHTADRAMELIDRHAPDVATIDLRLSPHGPPDEGLSLAERLRVRYPDVGLLAVSANPDPVYVERLLSMEEPPRAVGFLAKSQVGEMAVVVDALTRVARGELVVDPYVVRLLMSRRRSDDPLATLTPREREILALVATGLSNLAIAQRLSCAISNVEKNLSTVFGKLGLMPGEAGRRGVNLRVLATLAYLRSQGKT
uniref:response regulator transcription factor n=1 Tax=Herbidospora sakaeratensis TaxID=564415 RepID=UPI000780E7A0|nr:response regulator transcription factor [Herbidospora sakaeratensis]